MAIKGTIIYVSSYPRSEEDELKTKNVWLKGHTGKVSPFSDCLSHSQIRQDHGSITVLWSQPVAALQVLCPDGHWRWVKHIPNAVVSDTRFISVVIAPFE